MKLSELVNRMHARNRDLTKQELLRCVKTIHASITETLAGDGRVEIRGFGTFFLSDRPAHEIRNPRSGKVVWIPARRIPRFKAGKLLRASIDKEKGTGQSART